MTDRCPVCQSENVTAKHTETSSEIRCHDCGCVFGNAEIEGSGDDFLMKGDSNK